MSEARKAEFTETWQDETERLYEIRPEGFGPRRLEKCIAYDNENFRNELERIYAENVLTSDENKPEEPEIFVGSFGTAPLEPAAIHYIAMREAGLPVRFQGTGSTAESEGIYRVRPVPATGKSKRICLTWAHRDRIGEIQKLELIAANEQPLGILIENTVAGRYENEYELLPHDLNPEYATNETKHRLGVPHNFYMDMLENGHLARFFLTQHILKEQSNQAMKWAAENEKSIIKGKTLEYPEGVSPSHDLELAYTYFRFRQYEKIEPISIKELLELQESVYRIGMSENSNI